jgi:hypothetical protein
MPTANDTPNAAAETMRAASASLSDVDITPLSDSGIGITMNASVSASGWT